MKKLYTTSKYKKWHKRRLLKFNRLLKKRKNSKKEQSNNSSFSQVIEDHIKSPVAAIVDFRLIENTQKCLTVFKNIRSELFISKVKGFKFITLNMTDCTHIDYGTISILTAIMDDLKTKKILFRTMLPKNPVCKQFVNESGYLNNQVNGDGKPFKKTEKSELIFFEKGNGVLSERDNIKISNLVKDVVNHLTGESKYCLPVKTIILEICGNSIEWSGTTNQQWLLGVKYEDKKVIFTVTDVGKGILHTLNRTIPRQVLEVFTSDSEILKGAFNKKYASASQEVNRNKGLPAVKTRWELGTIKNLKVLTNNVILHFDNETLTQTFSQGSSGYGGTFYQWEMNSDCINKTTI